MGKLILFVIACSISMLSYAQRYDIYVHQQTMIQPNNAPLMGNSTIDVDRLSNSFAEGQNIRKAWDARKARKQHDKAMQEMSSLDLNDNNAVMEFAKKYPDSIDSLKSMLQLHTQLNN
ncbi:hypothetical protein I3252_05565 [Psychrobacter sp. Ps4]|uniref:hypothetical protein n=1 Tax=Psychrobacter sp. Ps4 TaxID=2790958 RepID=UPI001EDE7B1D|nr:hypothetical protein [Psychrobacter sp. Ps4]MCG3808952.1 hypothetical protein [Psychrobacter sp. Ps4]